MNNSIMKVTKIWFKDDIEIFVEKYFYRVEF